MTRRRARRRRPSLTRRLTTHAPATGEPFEKVWRWVWWWRNWKHGLLAALVIGVAALAGWLLKGVLWKWRPWSWLVCAFTASMTWLGWDLTSLLVTAVYFGGGLTAWLRWGSKARRAFGVKRYGWWAGHRLKQTVARQWLVGCHSAGLLGSMNKQPPRLGDLHYDRHGTVRTTIASGLIGVPVENVAAKLPELRSAIGCRDIVVRPTGPSHAEISFCWLDPIGSPLPLEELPPPPTDGPPQASYGIRRDGSPATIRIGESVLIGGLTRKGKSNIDWALLASILDQGYRVHLYVSDPKGGIELPWFKEAMEAAHPGLLKVRGYASTAAETNELLKRAEKAMHAREDDMKADGIRKIERPTDKYPLVVVLLDETLALESLLKQGANGPLGRIAYMGSASLYVAWINTQSAQLEVLGPIRRFVPQRICVATRAPQDTDAVLGQYAESIGAVCSKITEPGVGYSLAEGEATPQKFRAAMVTDAQAQAITRGLVPTRMSQPVLTTATMRRKAGYAVKQMTTFWWLYWWYDENDVLLYVGKTNRLGRRAYEHQDQPWWERADHMKSKRCRTEAEVLRREEEAIKRERPLFNKTHNLDNPDRILTAVHD